MNVSTSIFLLDHRSLETDGDSTAIRACRELARLVGSMPPTVFYEGWAEDQGLGPAATHPPLIKRVEAEVRKQVERDWVPLFFLHVIDEAAILDAVVRGLEDGGYGGARLFLQYSSRGYVPGSRMLDIARHGKKAHTINWPTPDLADIADYACALTDTLRGATEENNANPLESVEAALRMSANAGNARLAKLLFDLAGVACPQSLQDKISRLEQTQ